MFLHSLRKVLFNSLQKILPFSAAALAVIGAVSAISQPAAPAYVFSHLAGPLGGFGNADGPALAARFKTPGDVAIDGAGNLYVADTENHTIRKISSSGIVSTLAGKAGSFGNSDGTGSAARFNLPKGVAVDSAGNVYVADYYNCTIRKITPSGEVTTFAGTPGDANGNPTSSADGTGAAARFSYPRGVAIDIAGNVYVADGNYTIRKITPGAVVTTLAGSSGVQGSDDGTGSAAKFSEPFGIAVDATGNIYVVDRGNYTIRKINQNGSVSTLAGTAMNTGALDGTGASAQFNYPGKIAVDSSGNAYVTDESNHTIRKISAGGVVTTLAGTPGAAGSSDGTGKDAKFNFPRGIAVDGAGNVFVSDQNNSIIRKITPTGASTTVAGTAGGSGNSDGTGSSARFYFPQGITTTSTGILYVADYYNHSIRKVMPDGTVTTVSTKFVYPTGIVVDHAGSLYVTDSNTIYKVTPDGTVSNLAGGPPNFFSVPGGDGIGLAAQFNFPAGLAVDDSNNVYVADQFNHTIRKITPTGGVSTLAGTAGVSGSADGTGADAQFTYPNGIALDGSGNIYVADWGNNTIRKITPNAVVTTIAGSAGNSGSNDGKGAAARFDLPVGLAVDAAGNIYVTDANSTIRKVTPDGLVTTLAGTAGVDGSVDGVGTHAQFNHCDSIAVDQAGNLYVTDSYNHAVRKGQSANTPSISAQPQNQSAKIGDSVQFSATATSSLPLTYQWYFNDGLFAGATNDTLKIANVSGSDAGNYTVVISNAIGSVTSNKATLSITSVPAQPSSGGGGGIGPHFVLFLVLLSSTYRRSVGIKRRVNHVD